MQHLQCISAIELKLWFVLKYNSICILSNTHVQTVWIAINTQHIKLHKLYISAFWVYQMINT